MPRTSIRRAVQKARKDEKLTKDSFQNPALNLGIGTDNASSYSTYGFNPITRVRTLLEWMYRGNCFSGLAVDLIADDMTRAGIEVTTPWTQEDGNERFIEALQTWAIWQKLNEAIRWARLYGGALVVPLIDGQDLSSPLRIETVGKGSFKGLVVLDRWMVEPSLSNLVTEFGPDIGLPKFYDVHSDAPALRGKRIHHSRAFRFIGIQLPFWQATMENLWGLSVYERNYDRLVAVDSATTGASQKMYKSFLRTLKLKGFREAAAAGGPALTGIQRQVDLMRKFQGQEQISIVDGDDEFQIDDNGNVSGFADLLLQLMQQLSGGLQTPLTRMLGQSPAGLNSTGESDNRTYEEGIKKQQETQLRRPVDRISRILCASERIEIGDRFNFQFNALSQMSEKEKSDDANVAVDAIGKAVDGNLIPPHVAMKELRQRGRVNGFFTSITDEMIAEAEKNPPVPMVPTRGELDPEKEAIEAGQAGGKPNLKAVA